MKNNKNSPSNKGAPKWATASIKQSLDDMQRLREVMHVSRAGIAALRGVPKIVEVLQKYGDGTPQEYSVDLERATKEADFAQREVTEEFPVLHSWITVALWSHLEFCVRNFLIAQLKNDPSSWKLDSVLRVNVKLADFFAMKSEERSTFVIEQLEKDKLSGKTGIDRFEALLEVFAFSGHVPKSVKDKIYEFQQIRNLIAHNSSRFDRRFKKSCPWVKGKHGLYISVTPQMLNTYFAATELYILILICRIGEKYNIDMSSVLTDIARGAEELASKKSKKRKPAPHKDKAHTRKTG